MEWNIYSQGVLWVGLEKVLPSKERESFAALNPNFPQIWSRAGPLCQEAQSALWFLGGLQPTQGLSQSGDS